MTDERGIADDELMLGVRRGDTGSFAELFRRHSAPIFGYLARLTGDRHAAEELTQETFLAALRAGGEYRAEGKFRPWLFAIATNRARNEMARVSRERARRKDHEELAPMESSEIDPAEKVVTDERAQAVREALLRLPVDERSVVLLRHYHGLSFAEVAAALEVPEGTAKSRMRYALEKLRRSLEPQLGKM